jgi:hypothetical protein
MEKKLRMRSFEKLKKDKKGWLRDGLHTVEMSARRRK